MALDEAAPQCGQKSDYVFTNGALSFRLTADKNFMRVKSFEHHFPEYAISFEDNITRILSGTSICDRASCSPRSRSRPEGQ